MPEDNARSEGYIPGEGIEKDKFNFDDNPKADIDDNNNFKDDQKLEGITNIDMKDYTVNEESTEEPTAEINMRDYRMGDEVPEQVTANIDMVDYSYLDDFKEDREE